MRYGKFAGKDEFIGVAGAEGEESMPFGGTVVNGVGRNGPEAIEEDSQALNTIESEIQPKTETEKLTLIVLIF